MRLAGAVAVSLHDALPIYRRTLRVASQRVARGARDGPRAVVRRCRRRGDGPRAQAGRVGQRRHIWYWRHRVADDDVLRLGGAVAVAVVKRPGDNRRTLRVA